MGEISDRNVAVLGTGVIGASWATLFLAKGWRVSAWDPAPGAEAELRRYIETFLPGLMEPGYAPEEVWSRLHWCPMVEEAVAGVSFIQESGPERVEVKRQLFSRLDDIVPSDVVVASSSSTMTASVMQEGLELGSRIVVGHPFNPPHLIPLVEVAGGSATEPWAVEKAMQVYRDVGKYPIRLKREIRGHIANRLQSALWREAIYLVREGVADAEDIDIAITEGPGLRWALVGPFTGMVMAVGNRGLDAFFEGPIWQEVENTWRELGDLTMDPALARLVGEGLPVQSDPGKLQALAKRRDIVLRELIRQKNDFTA